MLKRKDAGLSELDVAFKITESPLSIDSDQVIGPIGIPPIEIEPMIRDRMRRVQDLLVSAASVDRLAGVSLCVCEGFDVSFQKEEIPLEFLTSRVVSFYAELGYMPSTVFLFTFDSDSSRLA